MTDPMTSSASASETAAFDDGDLAALEEAIAQVLSTEADRLSLHQHIDGKIRLDQTLWKRAGELGWPAISLPEEFGGLGFGPKGLDLLHRQLGHHVAPGSFLATLSAAQTISEAGDDELKAQWLPRLASGECKLAVIAQLEPSPDASQAWVIGDPDADAALVPNADGGLSLVQLGEPDVVQMWDRTRTLLAIDLGNCKPLATLPGVAASQILARHLSLAIASDSIGAARAITEITIEYMKEREQFGRAIASFQALKHRIADHMTDIVSGEEFLSLAVDFAARDDPDADIWAKLAKARCTESFVRIAQDCLQLHGGVGFTWEFDVHMYLNRARLSELLVASNSRMKDDAAAGLAEAFRAGREPLELA